ncbi:MAG: flippase [Chloroflexi bacterium]|nr:flippase [Chloroflexota bacterium]
MQSLLALSGGEVVARAIGFIATAYLARSLGPAAFGIVGFAYALAGYFSLTIHQGFLDIGSRAVAREPGKALRLAASGTVVRLVLALGLFIALTATAWILDKPLTVKLAVMIMGLSTFALALDTSWVYKGLERNRLVGLALVIGQGLYLLVVLTAVHGPADVLFVPSAMVLGEFSAALLLGFFLLRAGRVRFHIKDGLELLKASGFPTLGIIFRSLIFTFDVVLIGLLMGSSAVGVYSASYRIVFLLLAISIAIKAAYLPSVTRAAESGPAQVATAASRSVELSSAIGFPAVIGGIVLATPLLNAVFGSDYVEGARAFQVLLLSIGFVFLSEPLHNVFVACNKLKQETAIIGTAAGVNILLNIVLIPRFGMVGAAIATAAAEGLLLVVGLAYIYRLGVKISLVPLFRAVLLAGLMGLPVALVDTDGLGTYVGLIASVALGVGAYAAVVVIFRGVPKDLEPMLGPTLNKITHKLRPGSVSAP